MLPADDVVDDGDMVNDDGSKWRKAKVERITVDYVDR